MRRRGVRPGIRAEIAEHQQAMLRHAEMIDDRATADLVTRLMDDLDAGRPVTVRGFEAGLPTLTMVTVDGAGRVSAA